MKVPKGKTVYYGGKKLVPGSEISDGVAELVGIKKPKPGGSGGSGGGGSAGGGKPDGK